jgi:DNA-binding FadR family transcriptional regulator
MLSSVLALSANRKADPLIYALGPRARRVYIALRATILSGAHVPGDKLPSHLKLAVEYGVAPLTLRHVLAQLEADGLVSREHGRGTFIQACTAPGVLVVDDDRVSRMVLSRQLHLNGYQPLEAADPAAALAILQQVARIALVLTDVRTETVETFRASSASDLDLLTQALEAGQHEAVLLVAHRLKGVAATMGAERMRSVAHSLELGGHQRSLAGAMEQLRELESARAQALAASMHEVTRSSPGGA